MSNKIKYYFELMRLNKPVGIYLLLWPTLWALWIASQGQPQPKILFIFIVGTIILRSAGCVMNDIADKNFDLHVERTKNRPLTAGKIKVKEAFTLLCILLSIGFVLVLFLNALTIELALLGAFLLLLYPFLKRYTHWPQFGLGIAFSWSVPMAFAAELNQIPFIAWMLFFAGLIWTMAYDSLYAMVDRTDDLKIGIKSTAILFGSWDKSIIGLLQCIFLITLLLISFFIQRNVFFYVGLFLAFSCIIYQQYLIKERNPEKCFKAFVNNQWLGFFVFLGLIANYI